MAGIMTEEEKARRARLEAFNKLIEEGVGRKSLLSQIELSAEEEKRQLGQRLVDEKLAALAPEDGEPKPCPRCGKLTRVRARGVPRTFKSLSGTHTFQRNTHYCETCREGFAPRDEELGLSKDSAVSTEVAKRLSDFFMNDPFHTAEKRWPLHYPHLPVSANQFRQDAERLGEAMEASAVGVLESALKPPGLVAAHVLYVQNDGALVSMQSGEWKEVKSAVLFESGRHARGTDASRGVISQARYVSVLGGQDAFKTALKAALQIENAVRAASVVWIADGAKGNWALASQLAPTATQILDWYHAAQHAADCAKALFGEQDACVAPFRQRLESLLFCGNVQLALRELRACIALAPSGAPLKALTQLIGYYRENQRRMAYDVYRERGLLIGSGVIESAHRHVIHARMKRAGQHWGEDGGRRMARMRAAYITAGPARFFDAIHWAHRETLRYKGVAKPPKRRASNR